MLARTKKHWIKMSVSESPRQAFDLTLHKVKKLLDAQQRSATLSFSDAFLGDAACPVIAQYLQDNPHVTNLDLKGNNISSEGIKQLASIFRPPVALQTVNFEWNNIGVLDQGVEILSDALASNRTVVSLDLRNNKIGADGAGALANMLKSNTTLQVIDLRWNEVGAAGGRSLLSALSSNRSLKRIELAGNKIPEDTLARIDAILTEVKESSLQEKAERRPASKGSRSGSPAPRWTSPVREEEVSAVRVSNQSFVQARSDARAAELEMLLEQERRRTKELRMELLKDLDQEKTLRTHSEDTLAQIKEEAMKREMKDSRTIEALEMRLSELTHEKGNLQGELSKHREYHERTVEGFQEKVKTLENKVASLLRNHAQSEESLRSEIERLRLEHNLELERVNKDWERQLGYSEEQFRKIKVNRDELDEGNKALKSNMLSMRVEHDAQLKQCEDRVREETERRFMQQIKLQDQKIKVLEENREMLNSRVEGLQQELGRTERRNTESQVDLENEILQLKDERSSLLEQIQANNSKIEGLHSDLVQRSNEIEELKGAIAGLNQDLDHKEKTYSEKQETVRNRQIMQEAQANASMLAANNAVLARRVAELEKQLKVAQSEIARIKAEQETLSESLRNNLLDTLDQHMAEHMKLLATQLQH
jgi:chromosome segregation ATPase